MESLSEDSKVFWWHNSYQHFLHEFGNHLCQPARPCHTPNGIVMTRYKWSTTMQQAFWRILFLNSTMGIVEIIRYWNMGPTGVSPDCNPTDIRPEVSSPTYHLLTGFQASNTKVETEEFKKSDFCWIFRIYAKLSNYLKNSKVFLVLRHILILVYLLSVAKKDFYENCHCVSSC